MKPSGRTRPERLIGIGIRPGAARKPSRATASWTARAPTLCRVRAYCRSAFPRPTTTRLVGFPVAIRFGGTLYYRLKARGPARLRSDWSRRVILDQSEPAKPAPLIRGNAAEAWGDASSGLA